MNMVPQLIVVSIILIGQSEALKTRQISSKTNGKGRLFVDAIRGTDSNSCGETRQQACKTLSKAVDLVNGLKNGGTIHLIGKHLVKRTPQVMKNIKITTDEKDRGGIVGKVTSLGNMYAIMVVAQTRRNKPSVSITNVHFTNINVLNDITGGVNLVIDNVQVAGSGGYQESLILTRDSSVKITNSNFRNSTGIDVSNQKEVFVRNSTFKDFKGYYTSALKLINCQNVLITDSVFDNGKSKYGDTPCLKMESLGNTEILNCKFTRCRSKDGGAINIRDPQKTIRITQCHFMENAAASSGGAVSLFLDKNRERNKCQKGKKQTPVAQLRNCVFTDNTAGGFGQSIYSNMQLHLENVTMLATDNNSATHLHVDAGQIILKNISIRTHNIGTFQSSMIRPGIFISTTDLLIKGELSFLCPKHFHVKEDHSSYDSGQKDEYKKEMFFTSFRATCVSCPYDRYTTKEGTLTVHPYRVKHARKIIKIWRQDISKEECLPCPVGARCSGNVIPLDNFWGYLINSTYNSRPVLQFIMCPLGYCCSGTSCKDYNSCTEGRHGTLCSKCNQGYSLSFFSDDCVYKEKKKCNLVAFLFYFKVLSLLYTLSFTFVPLLISVVKDICSSNNQTPQEINDETKLISRDNREQTEQDKNETNETNKRETDLDKSKNEKEREITAMDESTNEEQGRKVTEMDESTSEEQEGEITDMDEGKSEEQEREITIRCRTPSKKTIKEPVKEVSLPYTAFVIVILFFFQVASLLHVKTPTDSGTSVEFLRHIFDSVVNIRILASRTVCPMDDLVLPTKKFLNASLKLDSMFNLFLLFIAWKIIATSRKYCSSACTNVKPDNPDSSRNLNQTPHVPLKSLAFPSLLKIGFLRLVKLNITSISTVAFQMVHCEEINGNQHLYLYGEHKCYSFWQYILLFIILPVVLVFPLALHVSLNLLKKRLITTNMFLLASVFPYYAVFLHAKHNCNSLQPIDTSGEEESCTDAILESEEEPFKTHEGYAVRWSVWQVYRNFLIVVMSTWIINPIYRTTWFLPVFVLFILQDRLCMPYKHPYMNFLQSLSSSCLCIIAACNFPASLSVMFNISSVPHMQKILFALQCVEMTMYGVVPLSLVAWKVKEKCCPGKKKTE